MSASCAVVSDEIVAVLSALIPSEFKVAMSVETSGRAVLYAAEALEPTEVTEEFCILSNH